MEVVEGLKPVGELEPSWSKYDLHLTAASADPSKVSVCKLLVRVIEAVREETVLATSFPA